MKKTGADCLISRSDVENQKETGTHTNQGRTTKPHQQGVEPGWVTEKDYFNKITKR